MADREFENRLIVILQEIRDQLTRIADAQERIANDDPLQKLDRAFASLEKEGERAVPWDAIERITGLPRNVLAELPAEELRRIQDQVSGTPIGGLANLWEKGF